MGAWLSADHNLRASELIIIAVNWWQYHTSKWVNLGIRSASYYFGNANKHNNDRERWGQWSLTREDPDLCLWFSLNLWIWWSRYFTLKFLKSVEFWEHQPRLWGDRGDNYSQFEITWYFCWISNCRQLLLAMKIVDLIVAISLYKQSNSNSKVTMDFQQSTSLIWHLSTDNLSKVEITSIASKW